MGRYLNRHLEPHMLNLALDITGLTNDDLFYYKNKPRLDHGGFELPIDCQGTGSRPRMIVSISTLPSPSRGTKSL